MVEPVDSACLRSTFVRLTGQDIAYARHQGANKEQLTSIAYSTASWRNNLTQVVRRDSSVYLETQYGRVHQDFVAGQADSASFALSDLVLGVRDACGGKAPLGRRDLIMFSPSYERWFAPGTTVRVSIQMAPDQYRLLVDTAASRVGSSGADPAWVPVNRVKISQPPKGSTIATACWDGDSRLEGTVVALVRSAKTDASRDVLQAWHFDAATLRFSAGSTT
jgi:hypothetical protein